MKQKPRNHKLLKDLLELQISAKDKIQLEFNFQTTIHLHECQLCNSFSGETKN